MTTPTMPQCYKCRRLFDTADDQWIACGAFPDGIPDEIADGEHDHTKPFPGDNGILFEPLPE